MIHRYSIKLMSRMGDELTVGINFSPIIRTKPNRIRIIGLKRLKRRLIIFHSNFLSSILFDSTNEILNLENFSLCKIYSRNNSKKEDKKDLAEYKNLNHLKSSLRREILFFINNYKLYIYFFYLFLLTHSLLFIGKAILQIYTGRKLIIAVRLRAMVHARASPVSKYITPVRSSTIHREFSVLGYL